MELKEKKQTVVGIYLVPGKDEILSRHLQDSVPKNPIERITIDGDVRELRRSDDRKWKTELIKAVSSLGYDVVSNPSILVNEQDGVQIVMSVIRKNGIEIGKSKPVVRSGKNISSTPVIGRTMASLRRERTNR